VQQKNRLLARPLPSVPIIYNVTFHSRPFGFWIKPFNEHDNAFISEIDDNLTNQIYVGSLILSINDEFMVGKPFSQLRSKLSEAPLPLTIQFSRKSNVNDNSTDEEKNNNNDTNNDNRNKNNNNIKSRSETNIDMVDNSKIKFSNKKDNDR